MFPHLKRRISDIIITIISSYFSGMSRVSLCADALPRCVSVLVLSFSGKEIRRVLFLPLVMILLQLMMMFVGALQLLWLTLMWIVPYRILNLGGRL